MKKVLIENVELGNTGEISKDKINNNFNELNAALSGLDDESLKVSAVSHELGFSTAKIPSEYAVSYEINKLDTTLTALDKEALRKSAVTGQLGVSTVNVPSEYAVAAELSKKADIADLTLNLIHKGTVEKVSDLPKNENAGAVTGAAYYVVSEGYIYQYDGSLWNKTVFTNFPADVALKGGTEKTLKEVEDCIKFMPVSSPKEYDKLVSVATYEKQQARKTADGKWELYAAPGDTPAGGHVGIRNQNYKANTPYTFRALFKITGFLNLPSGISPYIIYTVNGNRIVKTVEVTNLGNHYYLYSYELEAQPVDFTLSFFGPQAGAPSPETLAAANSIICHQVQVYEERSSIPALENVITEKITEYIDKQFDIRLEDVALKEDTDNILKLIEDETKFMPVPSAKEYNKLVSVATLEKQQARRTADGKWEFYTAPGDTPAGGHVGIRNQNYKANTPYTFRALFKITGFLNLPSGISPYIIYTVNGNRIVKTVEVTDLGNQYYLYSYELEAQPADFTLSFFGPQAGAPSAETLAAENSIICHQVQVYEGKTSDIPDLENQLTSAITKHLDRLDYMEIPRLSSNAWINELYGSAVARPGNNGFTVPAGGTFNPSFTAVRFSIPYKKEDSYFEIYFRMPEKISGTSFFALRYNANSPNGRYYPVPQVPVHVEEDLWRVAFTIVGDATNIGRIDMAIQQEGKNTYDEEFYVYWEKAYYWQNYPYGEKGEEGYTPYAIEHIASTAIDKVLGNNLTEIVVSTDPEDTEASFTGNNAIQLALNSITDASPVNRYRIFVKKGIYKVTNSSQFLGFPGYPAMILMKNHVDVVGEHMDECIIWAELPYEDSEIDTNYARILHQTVWNYSQDNCMENLTLVAKNIRYVLHQDNALAANSSRHYKNVKMEFIGDKGGKNTFGLGTHQGEENYVEGGEAISSTSYPFACHNNSNFSKRSLWSFKDFRFSAYNTPIALHLQNCGSKVNDEIRLEGCSFGGRSYMINYANLQLSNKPGYDYFNHADFRITGYGNAPFLFANSTSGQVLKITTKATGKGNTVRFISGSSAFHLLISEPVISQADVFVGSREITDGYMYRDGSLGLPAYAMGCKDVGEYSANYDNGVIYTSLGKRLGNCSAAGRNLIIDINDVSYSVVFNKDYTNMDNESILAEINAVIGEVATAELHYYGREYYPMMPDVAELALNGSTAAPIPKGTVVRKHMGRVYPCNAGYQPYGVALDDIPVFENIRGEISGQGRIMKRGYIYTISSQPHFVLSDSDRAVVAGNRFRIENGMLVKDPEGFIYAMDTNIVGINC